MSKFDEDAYRNNQLNKYLEDDIGDLSNCCEAEIDIRGLCTECLEHCESISDEHENAMYDKADMECEERRERE